MNQPKTKMSLVRVLSLNTGQLEMAGAFSCWEQCARFGRGSFGLSKLKDTQEDILTRDKMIKPEFRLIQL